MPRDITVTFADGSTAQYKNTPDNITPEQVTERAQADYGQSVTALDGGKKGGIGDAILRKLDVAGSAAMRGITALPALVGDVGNFFGNNIPTELNPFDLGMRASGATQEQVDQSKVRGMPISAANSAAGTQPATPGEKYLASTVEGVTGALAGPGGAAAPIRTAIAGAGSGLGSELAGNLSGNNPLARLAGALAGGGVASVATNAAQRIRPQAADLAREGMEGISEETLRAAQRLQAKAKSSGVNLDLAQALEAVGAPAGNLTTIRNVLANSRHGTAVQQGLHKQPLELELAADAATAKLPGPVWGPEASANAVQEAATGAVNAAKQQRSQAVRGMYEKAGVLPEGSRQALLDQIDNLMQRPGTTETFNRAAGEMRRKLQGETSQEAEALKTALENLRNAAPGKGKALAAQEVQAATQAMRTTQAQPLHAADVDTIISDAVGAYKGTPLSPVDPKSAGQVKHLAGQMNKQLSDMSPELAAAEAKFAQMSQDVVNPLKQSVVGQLATPRGYRPDVQASAAKLEAIFSKGSDAQVAEAARTIPKMFNELRKVDPEAAPAAAKAFIRSRIDTAIGSLPGETVNGAVTSPGAARALRDSLFANRAQEQGMKDMAVGMARSYGLPEAEVVRGLTHFMQITKGLASRPEKVGGLNWGDVAKAGGKSSLADVARVYGFMPFERVARKIEDATLAKTFQEFDRVLTTPEGADLLLKLSKTRSMSDKAAMLIANFGAAAATTPADQEPVAE